MWWVWPHSVALCGGCGLTVWPCVVGVASQCGLVWWVWPHSVALCGGCSLVWWVWPHSVALCGGCSLVWWVWPHSVALCGGCGLTVWPCVKKTFCTSVYSSYLYKFLLELFSFSLPPPRACIAHSIDCKGLDHLIICQLGGVSHQRHCSSLTLTVVPRMCECKQG